VPDDAAENSAGGLFEIRRVEVQRREPRARRYCERETDAAPDHRVLLWQLVAAKQKYTRDQHENRKQISGCTEQNECDVREPSAGRPHAIRNDAVAAGHAESRIRRAVAQEREQQDHAQTGQYPERSFAEPPQPGHEESFEGSARFSFIQVALQLVDLMR